MFQRIRDFITLYVLTIKYISHLRKPLSYCETFKYIHQSNSITTVSLNLLIRSTWVSSLIPNLTYNIHIEQKIKKCNEMIRLIRRLIQLLQKQQFVNYFINNINARQDSRFSLLRFLRFSENVGCSPL